MQHSNYTNQHGLGGAPTRPSKIGGGFHEFSAARPAHSTRPTFIVGHNHTL